MAYSKKKFLLVITTFILPIHALLERIDPPVEVLYQFGDSLSDTGNLIRESRMGKNSNFAKFPYGQDYFKKPTGRCSNGRLMIDFIAEYFRLPYLEPYLNKKGDFRHGVNFAVGGATVLNTSTLQDLNIFSMFTLSTLDVQLSWFKSYLSTICSNPLDCKNKLASALFIVGAGGNDFNYAFFQGHAMEQVFKIVPDVHEALKRFVEELIRLGASRIVFTGNFPIGCWPIYLGIPTNTASYDKFNCSKEWNGFVIFENNFVQQTIIDLRTQHPQTTIIYADYYSAFSYLLQHASAFGFDENETHVACCGLNVNEYNFDMSRLCGDPGYTVCADPYRRVSWDGVLPTEHAYQVITDYLLKRNIVPGLLKRPS